LKTRDKDSIKSHAQKHFIKLFRENKALPAKVQETGEGHTLSGKPLDPNSAAAVQYMGGQKKKKEEAETATSENGEKKEDDSTTSKKVKKEKKPVREADIIPEPEVPQEYVESGRTNYAKSRLRMNNTNPLWKDDEIDPLTLVKCQHFSGTPVTVALSQPFKVKVNSNVLLVSDFHSHLAYTEIIGFLAGDWNENEKLITIDEAFPCKSLASGSDNVNVEMDPTSELEVREIINKKRKKSVWMVPFSSSFSTRSQCERY